MNKKCNNVNKMQGYMCYIADNIVYTNHNLINNIINIYKNSKLLKVLDIHLCLVYYPLLKLNIIITFFYLFNTQLM